MKLYHQKISCVSQKAQKSTNWWWWFVLRCSAVFACNACNPLCKVLIWSPVMLHSHMISVCFYISPSQMKRCLQYYKTINALRDRAKKCCAKTSLWIKLWYGLKLTYSLQWHTLLAIQIYDLLQYYNLATENEYLFSHHSLRRKLQSVSVNTCMFNGSTTQMHWGDKKPHSSISWSELKSNLKSIYNVWHP